MENAILTPASRSHAVVCQLKEGWPPSFGTSTSSTVTPLLVATRSHRPAYIGHQDSMPILCDASGSHIASSLPPPLETRHLPSLKREQADTIAGGIPTLISFIPPSGDVGHGGQSATRNGRVTTFGVVLVCREQDNSGLVELPSYIDSSRPKYVIFFFLDTYLSDLLSFSQGIKMERARSRRACRYGPSS